MQALADAVSAANDLRLSCPELTEASTLLQHVRRVTLRAAAAIRVVDREAMETVVRECEAINLRTPDVAQIKALLQLPPDEFLQHRLGAAVALNDADRVASITMDIKVQEERREGEGGVFACRTSCSLAFAPTPGNVLQRLWRPVPAAQVPELEATPGTKPSRRLALCVPVA